jgi:hypothetical protein
MAERKVVPFDEFYYQLKLMHLFLLHPVCHKTSLDGEFLPFKVFKTVLVFPEKKRTSTNSQEPFFDVSWMCS